MNVILVDGKNFCYRHAWTHRGLSSEGRSTSLIYGGIAGLISLAKKFPENPIVFVWDTKGTTWRHEMAAGIYKANRTTAPMTSDVAQMHQQIPIFRKFLKLIGIRQFIVKGLECDDLIGVLATEIIERKLFDGVIIHSSDKDFYQLLNPRIKILRNIKKKAQFMSRKDVEKEFGIPATRWVAYRSLLGDKSDNIPHPVKGLGPKAAAKYINAGVQPQYEYFELHSKKERKELAVLKDAWADIHRNFILSLIVCSPKNANLPEDVRERLQNTVRKLSLKRFHRKVSCSNNDGFKKMTKFMVEYELNSLFNQRRVLWNLAL